MAKFSVDTVRLQELGSRIEQHKEVLAALRKETASISMLVRSLPSIRSCAVALNRGIENIRKAGIRLEGYGTLLKKADQVYRAAEDKLLEQGALDPAAGGAFGSGQMHSGKSSGRDYTDWGKNPSSIRPVEYAYLAQFCNWASEEDSEAKMKAKFLELLKSLPEDHPLHNISPDKVKAVRLGTGHDMEAIVIEIDPDNAIVVFAGSNGNVGLGVGDYATDIEIAASGTPGIQALTAAQQTLNPVEWFTENQFEAANKLIDDLPYKNIKVTGHSLGGHLAADVTLNNSKVSECVTFDPPGRGDTFMRTTFDPGNRVSKITNYCAKGSPVSAVGTQIGTTHYVDVTSNSDAFFHNHDIGHIIDEHFGGMDAVKQPGNQAGGVTGGGSSGGGSGAW